MGTCSADITMQTSQLKLQVGMDNFGTCGHTNKVARTTPWPDAVNATMPAHAVWFAFHGTEPWVFVHLESRLLD